MKDETIKAKGDNKVKGEITKGPRLKSTGNIPL
jgi:hypothetical protein